MRRLVVGIVLALLVLSASGSGGATAPGPEVVSETTVDGRLRELVVRSPALGRDAGVRVLLPVGHDDPANAGRTWPVLWLLHGVGDDHRSWTERTDVEALTAGLPAVVAMPEAGRTPDAGWYSDWVEGPAWETFHLTELLPLVERRFRAGGSRERRAVVGFSMGGFGAMSYAARHPDLWIAAGSISGAVDTVLAGPAESTLFLLLHPYAGTPDDRVWGPYLTSEVVWRGHNPVDLATNLRPLAGALWVRTGNGVPAPGDDPATAPLEAGVYPMNLSLHGALQQHGIAHDWFDRGYGTHDWPYREADLAAILPGIEQLFAAPPGPPASFDHRFVEPQRSVFGWDLTVTDRDEPAFTELTAVSRAGLTAAGSGTLHVRTPGGYDGTWRVTVGDAVTEVAAASDGRLSFVVPLSSTPTAVALAPVPATPAGPVAPPVAGPGASTGRPGGTLPATGAPGGPALAAVVLALALASRAGRAAPRAPRRS